jgi:spermidine/putrescine transport system permease protein
MVGRLARPSDAVAALQLTPVLAFLAAFMAAPMLVFLLYSFWRLDNFAIVSDWNIDNYTDAISSADNRRLLWNTVRIAGMASVLTTVLGYAFAHVLRFHLRRHQERLLFVVIIASFSGYLVRIYSWRTLLGDQGIVNTVLQDIGLVDEPLGFLLFNRFAAVLVLANFLLPLAVLTIYAGMQNIRDGDVEAARDLGAGAFRAFRGITLPLAWPGIFTAFALCFIFAAGDYLTPQLVGGTSGSMVGKVIVDTFNAQFNWPRGAALSFLMLVIVIAILGVVKLVGNRVLR